MRNGASDDWKPGISPEKVRYLILKGREFNAKDVLTEPDPGSNPMDDDMIEILEEHPDDVVEKELASAIWALNEDEQIDLVALAWLGRGDGDTSDWDDLRHQAAEAHNNRTVAYLLGLPLLPDYLEDALDQFGESSAAAMEGKL
ncbi:DUF3775 domain-containing protein [Rhizobium bangladeshense]|uniref:DUF3775 domain-containing protein n=1 Tax=Rhizobium bangladeshense TaxID=1138189 RepID=UPI001C82E484|nr:DUF3775 domain-containing protein [Rhizobium bangladeshense]MBX4893563.1 DUF3775 domain-containing protein [Rhizobium bangladeshense]MBX4898913.1 DUF3775 domain-containing protein [Rhizobium bangladeshense]MBY3617009.1 DUF3775 domain-containing protein [Rhizobium bangladeshense]